MASLADKYGPEVQKVPADTPIEDILYLLKRDGGIFIKSLVSDADLDETYSECRHRLDADVAWDGNFFPSKIIRPLVEILDTYHADQPLKRRLSEPRPCSP